MTSPAPSTATKPQQQDARGFMFQVYDPTGAKWLEIEAVTEFSVDRSEGEEEAELTTFADRGQYRTQKMQRGATCELTARRASNTVRQPQPGTPTPGRKRVEQLERGLGDESVGLFRFRHVWEQRWEQWDAWVGVGETSGETNDKTEWECTWHRDGAERFFDKDTGAETDADGNPVAAATA